jgi:hypothetical protein
MEATWRHRPDDRPTFGQLVGMLEEARPEQLQAVLSLPLSSSSLPNNNNQLLEYTQGEIITVLDKQPAESSGGQFLWSGVNSQGRVGLFPPAHTVAYLGTLPGGGVLPWGSANLSGGVGETTSSSNSLYQSVGQAFQRSSLRGSRDRSSGRHRKISRDMISGPTGQVQHTGHIGPDGCFFGDVAFMSAGGGVGGSGTNGQLSSTMSTSMMSGGGRLPSTGSDNGLSSLSRADSDVSDSAPLLSSGGGGRMMALERPPTTSQQPRMGHAIGYLRQVSVLFTLNLTWIDF